MTPRSTLRQAGLFSLLTCAASGYLLYVDRHTALGLSLVETQSGLPFPIPAVFALLGILLIVCSAVGSHSASNRYARSSQVRKRASLHPLANNTSPQLDRNTRDPSTSPSDGWDHIRHTCDQVLLPPGATIHLDQNRPCPISLRMEMAAPERCKRAISNVAAWFSAVSIPPRFRIEFIHCPEGSIPRNHMVKGAIAPHIPRGDFKVIADRDAVDVIFHRPDNSWDNPETAG